MSDFNLDQYTDNDSLDLIERENWIHERERIARQLHLDQAISLPDDPEGKQEALKRRAAQFDILRVLNTKISPQATPEITDWDSIPDINREWLINNWMPANTVTMFTGEGGAGKSWLTLQTVCQIACGFRDAYLKPDFGLYCEQCNAPKADCKYTTGHDYQYKPPAEYDDNLPTPKHVVFATYEDEPAEIKRRLQALASGMSWIADSLTAIKQHLHIIDMRGIGSVWGPGIGKHIANTGDLLAAGKDLRKICESKQAKILVMDPLSGAFGGNENDRTAVYDFVSSFRGWGDVAKCAMLVIGHLPKSQEGKAAGFSGSTAWEASARSMWMLAKKTFTQGEGKEKETKYYWALEHTKSNYAHLQSEIPLIKKKRGWWKQANDREDAADAFNAYQESFNQQEDTDDDDENPNLPQF